MKEQTCVLCTKIDTSGIGNDDRFLCLECCIEASEFIAMAETLDEDSIPEEGLVMVAPKASDTAH